MSAINRRGFINQAGAGLGSAFGVAALGGVGASQENPAPGKTPRLPREVWIASISQNSLFAENPDKMVGLLLDRMEETTSMQPDIVCVPELGPFMNLSPERTNVAELAEPAGGQLTQRFAEFARKHRCYVWCPIYTVRDGRCFNALVLLDRQGKVVGEYHKMHPTVEEMGFGVTPGSLTPPVFDTDFGRIGAQICFDIEWLDGWQALHAAGAEIVFWSSAFAGGDKLNVLAGMFHYNIVSSTNKGVTRVCDTAGQTVAWTGLWQNWLCAPINLEKAMLHSWPYADRFNAIRKKYGQAVRLTTYHEQEWSFIESLSPDIKVADILKEFDIPTYDGLLAAVTTAQNKKR